MASELSRRGFLRLSVAALAGLTGCSLDRLADSLFPGSSLPVLPNHPTVSPSATALPNLWPNFPFDSSLYLDRPPASQKDPATVEDWQGIPLYKLTTSEFTGSLTSPLETLNTEIFHTGEDYLLSFYIRSVHTSGESFFWMRPLESLKSFGHSPRLALSETRRVWSIVHAVAPNRLSVPADPTAPPNVQSESSVYWLFTGFPGFDWSIDVRLGGFMVEPLGSYPRYAVAVIGDSTTAGDSKGRDHPMSREWTSYAAAFGNLTLFNRAVSGWTTRDMLANWDSIISPLAPVCRYSIIQGGLNDLSLNFDEEEVQQNILAMTTKSSEQGLTPIVATLTPYNVLAAIPPHEESRQAINRWILANFPLVLDFDAVVRDPADPISLRREEGWYGDGGHYAGLAKRAIGEYVAAWSGWDFPVPAPYVQGF